jgi:phenylalanyl-tRNA synthetase beta chain
VRRDIAVVAPTELSYAELSAQVAAAAGELLERHWLFDIYTGPGIPEGHRSLALGLQLRKMGANLNDEEANAVRDRVVQALESVGARLR